MIMGLRPRHAGVAVCLPMIMAAGSAATAAGLAPTVDPSHGGKAAAWRVITPPLVPTIGGPPPQQPHCHATDVAAHATTRLIPGGVAGLIHLQGDHCEIHSRTGPDELRGGDATLDVTAVPLNKQKDAPDVARSDIALDSGKVIWSFTWTGSWCGSHPTSVLIPLNKSHGEVMAPLTGPTPGCHANPGNQPSVLTAGPPGFPHRPDLAAPPAWSGLRASLHAPKVRRSGDLPKLSVTLTNPTHADITLAPCPSYALTVFNHRGDGGTTDHYGRALPCPYQARVIAANTRVMLRLPHSHFDPQGIARPGHKLTITFAILGVPAAVAHARVAK
jgi:hypothetical protein